MRYMIIIKEDEPYPPTTSELIAAMGKFNEELIDAGILLAAEGLQPSKTGAKATNTGGKLVIKDGPFTEAKELIGGFWIIRVDSYEEALNWMRKIPLPEGGKLELRRVSEPSDFTDDAVSHDALTKEQAWRDEGKI